MKRITSIALALLLLLGLCLPAALADDTLLILAPGDETEENEPLSSEEPGDLIAPLLPPPGGAKLLTSSIYGVIIEETETSITVQNTFREEDVIVIHLTERLPVVDAVTGQAATLRDRESDRVAVFYGPAVTMSLPPQSTAVAIAVNLPEQALSPHHVVVEAVIREEGAVKAVVQNGSLYITIAEDIPMLPYLTRNLVTLENIRPGAELLVWYDIVLMSYPGRTAAQRVVVLKTAPVETVEVSAEAGTATVNGETVELVSTRVFEGGTLALPMRQLCEALGYTVTWVPEWGGVELTREGVTARLEFGSPVCLIAGAAVTLEHTPMVEDGVTYVGPEFFTDLLSVFVDIAQ